MEWFGAILQLFATRETSLKYHLSVYYFCPPPLYRNKIDRSNSGTMTAAKRLKQRHRNHNIWSLVYRIVMEWYNTLRKILSLPKNPKLDLETQISNTADISNNIFVCIGSVAVGSYLLRGAARSFSWKKRMSKSKLFVSKNAWNLNAEIDIIAIIHSFLPLSVWPHSTCITGHMEVCRSPINYMPIWV